MFSTTLRIPDELGAFLQEAAQRHSQSVNAYVTNLLAELQAAERRCRLAADWAAYAAETTAQDVEYAAPAQAELAAERGIPYQAPSRRKRGKQA